jgi:putative ABC transport system permease protein
MANPLRDAVHRLDASLAVADVRVIDQVTDDSFSTPRFALFLVALFAGLALTLAATGIYGVVSYAVAQQMHEFGMRMALGATRWDIVRFVVGQGIRMTTIGVMIGLIASAGLGRFLGTLVYEVRSVDPLTFAAVGLLTTVVAVLACYVPARRATTADPMQALRSE